MNTFLTVLIISVLTHCIRTVYEIMKFRKRINPENKVVFGLIFTNMIILWFSWFAVCVFDPYKLTLPLVVKCIGAAILVLGVLLFLVSLAKIKRFENYHGDLITNGIYKRLRHPMYLSFICWLAGGAIFHQSGTAFLLAVVFTVNILVWRKLEEIHLMTVFPECKEYKRKTYF
ncbi:MAG: NnrU family protein [Bacteroidetes bacterium]|nr:NnrU family protein [Bacteroidota bacterium]